MSGLRCRRRSERGHPLGDLVDQLVRDGLDRDRAEIAMQRSPAELKPALMAASAAGRGGVGEDEHVVLRATESPDALTVGGGGPVDVFGNRVEPTKETALDVGQSGCVDGLPCRRGTTFMTPSGRPASFHSLATAFTADGSFSDGLMTTALPQAMAIGTNHSADHGGEVERRDDGDHTERLADREDVNASRDVLGLATLSRCRCHIANSATRGHA